MENKILAVVDGREIREGDLNNIIDRYPQEQRAYFSSDMGKKQILEQMIGFDLMNKLGLEMKLKDTQEYKDNLAQVEKDLLTQLTINKVLAEVTVTDEEALKYFEENEEMFKEKETVSAKHILVDNEELCLEVKNKIDSGELTFEEAAKQYSSCPSKEQGGSLGAFARGMMVPEFEKVAFESEIGKVTEPVQTQFGYHIIKVEAKNEAKAQSFENIKGQIVSKLIQERQQNKYATVIKELETKYDVKRF